MSGLDTGLVVSVLLFVFLLITLIAGDVNNGKNRHILMLMSLGAIMFFASSLGLGLNISLGLLFVSIMVTLAGSLKNERRIIMLGIRLCLISLGAIYIFRFLAT